MHGFDCQGLTDPGLRRDRNEDQFLIADLDAWRARCSDTPDRAPDGRSWGTMLVVADGIGGQPAGDVASWLVVETAFQQMLGTMEKINDDRGEEILKELSEVPHRCEAALSEEAASHPQEHGLGSTLTLAHVIWPHLYVLHVGHSRCYLLRGSQIQRLTHDQTMGQYLLDHGILRPEQAAHSPTGRALWSFIGEHCPDLKPELSKLDLQAGDSLMLCTDGLTRDVGDDQIADALRVAPSAKDACQRLLDAATAAGGKDNVTVVVGRFAEPGSRHTSA